MKTISERVLVEQSSAAQCQPDRHRSGRRAIFHSLSASSFSILRSSSCPVSAVDGTHLTKPGPDHPVHGQLLLLCLPPPHHERRLEATFVFQLQFSLRMPIWSHNTIQCTFSTSLHDQLEI
jgi:hypothetical protein